jgi:hypothetical protein
MTASGVIQDGKTIPLRQQAALVELERLRSIDEGSG